MPGYTCAYYLREKLERLAKRLREQARKLGQGERVASDGDAEDGGGRSA